MKFLLASASALALALSVTSSASAATEHFGNNTPVSDGTSIHSQAHGSGTNWYSVYANGLNAGSYVCVRIDGWQYMCTFDQIAEGYSASGLIKGWAYNGTGRTINMNAHMTYGQ